MTIAITRDVSSRINDCEITHIERSPIDINIARAQHAEYVSVLAELGCQVIELPQEPSLPDSVFVEDTAVIFPECALISRPGADSRRPETESIEQILGQYRGLAYLREPATTDGGDILVIGREVYVGLGTRSNPPALDQIQSILAPYDYKVIGVRTRDCLHLKSAVTCINHESLLINKNWVDSAPFIKYDCVEINPSEPFAANCLPMRGEIIYPTSFPKTGAILKSLGHVLHPVSLDELAKAEGAVTCCSLILD